MVNPWGIPLSSSIHNNQGIDGTDKTQGLQPQGDIYSRLGTKKNPATMDGAKFREDRLLGLSFKV